MKQILLLPLIFALSVSGLWAQQLPPGILGVVDTTWPGIQYEIFAIQRIAGDRLIVAIKIEATPKAPETTFLGIEHKMPQNPTPQDRLEIGNGKYRPDPVSIESATMTDENTKQTFNTVQPAPNGPGYPPSSILTNLNRGEVKLMSIQFPIPPPPQPVNGIIPKQTVSILLPNALGPITHVAIPPPTPPAAKP